jgi:hypothetical protein
LALRDARSTPVQAGDTSGASHYLSGRQSAVDTIGTPHAGPPSAASRSVPRRCVSGHAVPSFASAAFARSHLLPSGTGRPHRPTTRARERNLKIAGFQDGVNIQGSANVTIEGSSIIGRGGSNDAGIRAVAAALPGFPISDRQIIHFAASSSGTTRSRTVRSASSSKPPLPRR